MASTATAGVATGAGTRVDVTLKLSQLQNLCKRDPVGYREDYDAQMRRLESECGILKLSPHNPSPRLIELIQFAAAVSSSSYKGNESDRIAKLLIGLLVGDGGSTSGGRYTFSVLNCRPRSTINHSTIGSRASTIQLTVPEWGAGAGQTNLRKNTCRPRIRLEIMRSGSYGPERKNVRRRLSARSSEIR